MSEPLVYLDHNATSPPDPRVLEAMASFEHLPHANSRSAHRPGREVARAIHEARERVATCLGCEPDEVIFTSGGTEANNLAIKGLAWARGGVSRFAHLAVEHYSVTRAMAFLARQGHGLDVIAVQPTGLPDPASLDRALSARPALLAIQHANNEVGTLQDVAGLAARIHQGEGLILVDAAQSVGKLPIRFRGDGLDFLTGSGHKFGGPGGIGFLVRRRGIALEPLHHGAGHEDGLRSGTHAAALIVGLGVACELASREQDADARRMTALRDRLQAHLQAGLPELVVNGHPTLRLPHTLNVSVPGLLGLEWLQATPRVAATTGAACHSDRVEPSAVMKALGVPLAHAGGAIRLSLGRATTGEQVDEAAALLVASARALLDRVEKE
jgi:cysteine desulfurase